MIQELILIEFFKAWSIFMQWYIFFFFFLDFKLEVNVLI
jgi:hypothetical protein